MGGGVPHIRHPPHAAPQEAAPLALHAVPAGQVQVWGGSGIPPTVHWLQAHCPLGCWSHLAPTVQSGRLPGIVEQRMFLSSAVARFGYDGIPFWNAEHCGRPNMTAQLPHPVSVSG